MSSMVDCWLVVAVVGLIIASIFLAHAIDTYRRSANNPLT